MSVYNGGSFLGPAIESILGQSHTDFEFIVIDDGSSDGSADTIASYRDRRLRVIRHPENAGLAARLNQGFAVASGRYIARMDADDISMPERLERQIAFMQAHPYVGACGTWIEVAGGGVTQRWEYPASHRAIHARLLFDCAMAHPTVMFDRLRLQKARLSYDSSYPCAQDYDLWCRAVEDLSLANIPEVLLIRHLHAEQVGRRDANAQQRWAATIRRRQLERLGIKLTDQHGALHEAISTWSWPKTEVFLHGAHRFPQNQYRGGGMGSLGRQRRPASPCQRDGDRIPPSAGPASDAAQYSRPVGSPRIRVPRQRFRFRDQRRRAAAVPACTGEPVLSADLWQADRRTIERARPMTVRAFHC